MKNWFFEKQTAFLIEGSGWRIHLTLSPFDYIVWSFAVAFIVWFPVVVSTLAWLLS